MTDTGWTTVFRRGNNPKARVGDPRNLQTGDVVTFWHSSRSGFYTRIVRSPTPTGFLAEPLNEKEEPFLVKDKDLFEVSRPPPPAVVVEDTVELPEPKAEQEPDPEGMTDFLLDIVDASA